MSSRKWVSFLGLLTPLAFLLAACSEGENGPEGSWVGICVDVDGDGYGFQCAAGRDCNDNDRTIHSGCGACDQPNEGCECAADSAPIGCSLPYELTAQGGLLCSDGTRYCRDGKWTACEGIRSYEAPPPSDELVGGIRQSLDPSDAGSGSDAGIDAGVSTCDDPCHPDCHRVEPSVSGEGGTNSNIIRGDGGGITLSWTLRDAGVIDAGFLDDYMCELGTKPNDMDCNSVPDNLLPSGTAAPFETDHQTIFMELAPGQSASQNLQVSFKVATADVYFYLDMTGSMEDERDKLIESLSTGNYLPDGGVLADGGQVKCADRDFDGVPDDELKNQGVAGNIACLIRNARFGAGWFRDIPYDLGTPSTAKHGTNDYAMFEHRIDITDDVDAVKTSLSGFTTKGGPSGSTDYEEGSMQGLWAIATGGEVYPGWDRPGIPTRTGCPAGAWGWPCFRKGAVPIVIHVADQGLHNGPGTTVGGTDYKWPYLTLPGQKRGTMVNTDTGVYYQPLTTTAESFNDAQNAGTVDDKFITYTGNTEKMRSDLSFTTSGTCPTSQYAWDTTSQTGKDAVFQFKVGSYLSGTTQRTIKLSALGTRFNSSLQLLSAAPPATNTYSAANNGSFGSAYNLGTLPASTRVVVNGDSTTFTGSYPREGLTTGSGCFSNATADDTRGVSVVKFNLSADSNVKITSQGGTGVNTSLFSSATSESTNFDLGAINCGSGVSSNCNNKIGQFSLGDVSGHYYHLTGGNTGASGVTNDYQTLFSTSGWCSGTGFDATDQVVDFSLSRPTNLLIETSGSGSDLKASFIHRLLLVKRGASVADTTKTVANGNGDQATAATILDADVPSNGAWVKYSGDSASDTATYAQTEVGGVSAGICHNGNVGAAGTLKDVVFKLDVPSGGGNYEFETLPATPSSGYKTWLSLHKGSIARTTTIAIDGTDSDSSNGQPAAIQTQGSVNGRQIVLTGGQMEARTRTYQRSITGTNCGSGSWNNSYGGRDAVFRFHANANSTVKITTTGPTGDLTTTPAFDSYFAVYKTSISDANRVTGSCGSNPSGNGFTASVSVTSGAEYLIVVKEWTYNSNLNSTTGKYGLVIEDAGFTNSFLGCDAGSSSNTNFSKLTTTLSQGTHYIVVKGTGTAPNTKYSLNVRKTGSGASNSLVSCVSDSNYRASIERSGTTPLEAGDYSLIIKGRNNSYGTPQKGTYNLTIRDLDVAPKPIACHNTDDAASFTANSLKKNDSSGNPITYYLVTRGNTTSSLNQVVIEDAAMAAASTALACDNVSAGDSITNAQITKQLAPGTYYAVLKGRTASDQGWFQLSIGEDKTGVTSTGNFTPKTWQDTGGVREALLKTDNAAGRDKIRVIAVNAVHDSYSYNNVTIQQSFMSNSDGYKQTLVLAKETGGLASSKTSTYEIGTDGSGMGSKVIQAVSDLVGTLQMDLSLALDPAPDNPSPPFGFKVEALPNPGNCASTSDADGDGIKDTFTTCGPGAVPKFKITITNPISNPVPVRNPATLGYNMTLRLIGNRTIDVDQIPVYVIPSDVIQDPAVPEYAQSGTHEQTLDSACTGTDRPLWRSLYWNASLPAGTSIAWRLCSGDTDAEVASCTLSTAGTVTSGSACTQNSQCPDGYCASSGVCETVVGPTCSADADCGTGGKCSSGTCRWTQNPIDLLPALKLGLQGKKKMRVQALLNSSSDRRSAPTVNNWKLDYYCSPGL